MNKVCVDCGKEISKYAQRCVVCRNRYINITFVKGKPRTQKTKDILSKNATTRFKNPTNIHDILMGEAWAVSNVKIAVGMFLKVEFGGGEDVKNVVRLEN